jgi:monoamine oxidase
MNQKETIIIIGGGISGLIAARELIKHDRKVIVLEARDRLGGRVCTLFNTDPLVPIEAGAEFIHGELPLTLELLKEYELPYQNVGGKMIDLDKSNAQLQHDESDTWDLLMKKMEELKTDIPFADFLSTYFPEDKYESLRKSARNFANGFDLADPEKASTFSLYREWSDEQDGQFRVKGGYMKLVDALSADCTRKGCDILTSEIVKTIEWKKDWVNVKTDKGKYFSGSKAIITLPAGLWHADEGAIEFNPAIPEKINAFKEIGYGSIIKIALLFQDPFWKEKYSNPGFFFTNEVVPTWWTQAPEKNNLFTGWIGGVPAKKMENKSADELIELAIQSLASAFELGADFLKEILLSSYIFNWDHEIYSRGGYSFSTMNSPVAKQKLREPVDNTLFISGEALYDGPMQGTVEAALWAGKDSARKIVDR